MRNNRIPPRGKSSESGTAQQRKKSANSTGQGLYSNRVVAKNQNFMGVASSSTGFQSRGHMPAIMTKKQNSIKDPGPSKNMQQINEHLAKIQQLMQGTGPEDDIGSAYGASFGGTSSVGGVSSMGGSTYAEKMFNKYKLEKQRLPESQKIKNIQDRIQRRSIDAKSQTSMKSTSQTGNKSSRMGSAASNSSFRITKKPSQILKDKKNVLVEKKVKFMTEFSDVDSVVSGKSKLTNQIQQLQPNDLDSNQDFRNSENESDDANSDHEISSFSDISLELTEKEMAECKREYAKENQNGNQEDDQMFKEMVKEEIERKRKVMDNEVDNLDFPGKIDYLNQRIGVLREKVTGKDSAFNSQMRLLKSSSQIVQNYFEETEIFLAKAQLVENFEFNERQKNKWDEKVHTLEDFDGLLDQEIEEAKVSTGKTKNNLAGKQAVISSKTPEIRTQNPSNLKKQDKKQLPDKPVQKTQVQKAEKLEKEDIIHELSDDDEFY